MLCVAETIGSSQPHRLKAFDCGFPDEFVQLKSETRRNVVGKNPLGEFLRIEQAVRGVAGSGCVLAECGRKKKRVHALAKVVTIYEVAGEVIVGAAGEDELDFVARAESFQILNPKCIAFS